MGSPSTRIQSHVDTVLNGSDAIDEWRMTHRGEVLKLAGADLSDAKLYDADLSGANMVGAILTYAVLDYARLDNTNLSQADLTDATLFGAHACRANFRTASLMHTMLGSTDLSKSDLSGADISYSDLHFAKLDGANLTRANLSYSVLSNASLYKTVMNRTELNLTSIDDCDLNECIGLSRVNHVGPSSIGIDTLVTTYRARRNKLESDVNSFLIGAGVSDRLLEAFPSFDARVRYESCFVSYGSPDLAIAKRIVAALKRREVSCWLYSFDATPGARTWKEIRRARTEAKKMIVICSSKALVRDGTLKEIEEQIDEDPDKMIPISVDDLWKEKGFRVVRGNRDLKPFLMERNHLELRKGQLEDAIDRLLKALRRQSKPSST